MIVHDIGDLYPFKCFDSKLILSDIAIKMKAINSSLISISCSEAFLTNITTVNCQNSWKIPSFISCNSEKSKVIANEMDICNNLIQSPLFVNSKSVSLHVQSCNFCNITSRNFKEIFANSDDEIGCKAVATILHTTFNCINCAHDRVMYQTMNFFSCIKNFNNSAKNSIKDKQFFERICYETTESFDSCLFEYCGVSFDAEETNGGALYFLGSSTTTLTIKDCSLLECNCTGSGGAIFAKGAGSVSVSGTLFHYCSAEEAGGGVSFYNVSSMQLYNCNFTNSYCHKKNGGGASCVLCGYAEITCTTFNSCVSNLNCGGGVALESTIDNVNVYDCLFLKCESYGKGGGGLLLRIQENDSDSPHLLRDLPFLSLALCSFAFNSAKRGNDILVDCGSYSSSSAVLAWFSKPYVAGCFSMSEDNRVDVEGQSYDDLLIVEILVDAKSNYTTDCGYRGIPCKSLRDVVKMNKVNASTRIAMQKGVYKENSFVLNNSDYVIYQDVDNSNSDKDPYSVEILSGNVSTIRFIDLINTNFTAFYVCIETTTQSSVGNRYPVAITAISKSRVGLYSVVLRCFKYFFSESFDDSDLHLIYVYDSVLYMNDTYVYGCGYGALDNAAASTMMMKNSLNDNSIGNLCDWNNSLVKLEDSISTIENCCIGNSTPGGLYQSGGSVTITNLSFINIGVKDENFYSFKKSMMCVNNGSVVLNNVSSLPEEESKWINLLGCNLTGDEFDKILNGQTETELFFKPYLIDVLVDHQLPGSSTWFTLSGVNLYPCNIFANYEIRMFLQNDESSLEGEQEELMVSGIQRIYKVESQTKALFDVNLASYNYTSLNVSVKLTYPCFSYYSHSTPSVWHLFNFTTPPIPDTPVSPEPNEERKSSTGVEEQNKFVLIIVCACMGPSVLAVVMSVVIILIRRRKKKSSVPRQSHPVNEDSLDNNNYEMAEYNEAEGLINGMEQAISSEPDNSEYTQYPRSTS
eukprot:MONOS_3058.1-p1 / transcript=MONOS_3058.1 / gene=MONOS_3058 / organism=Monocercomonoides_exilis_PA203 / gene_product=unspecified product / transcript_product=unspecified product / location=Mono_scaffold00068:76586-79507(+) / protein_length=974 / sequence_SO=supercontig / SO=protein_coding / is_pseudo=false